ncbi:MAG TPA: hypothetical protein PLR96_02020 [Flavobacteriales bacterium]|nr:hypothetical protein [Flavobacteriales bacterium]
MRIRANSWDRSFVWYYVTEHVLLTTLVAGGLPLFILFSGSGRRSSSVENLIEFMTGHPHQILGLIIGIVVLMDLLLIVVRRQTLVVELELRSATMRFVTRGIAKRTIRTTEVPLAELKWVRYKTAAISPIPNYKGYRFYANNKFVGDLFLDHFTWDDRNRQVKDFLAELNQRVPIRAF